MQTTSPAQDDIIVRAQELVDALRKPMFVLTMANSLLRHAETHREVLPDLYTPGKVKSATTRARKAAMQVDQIVRDWCHRNGEETIV